MRPITDSPAETTIDRDIDQTAKHVHHFLGNEGCPTCKAVENYHEPVKLFTSGNEIELACDVDLGERVDEGNATGFKCDWCGTTVVNVQPIEIVSKWSGKRFAFCSDSCARKADPKYTGETVVAGPDSFGGEDFPTATAEQRRAIPRADDGKDTAEISRPVSPSILEFRIKQLEDELYAMNSICRTKDIRIENLTTERDNVTDLYKQACADRDAATFRARQFERFTDALANHLDALQAIANPANPRTNEYPKAA